MPMESLDRGIDRSGEEHEGNLRARPSRRADDGSDCHSRCDVGAVRLAPRGRPAGLRAPVIVGAFGSCHGAPGAAAHAGCSSPRGRAHEPGARAGARRGQPRDRPPRRRPAAAAAPAAFARVDQARARARACACSGGRTARRAGAGRGRKTRGRWSGKECRGPRPRARSRRPRTRGARGLGPMRGWAPCVAGASSLAGSVRSASR